MRSAVSRLHAASLVLWAHETGVSLSWDDAEAAAGLWNNSRDSIVKVLEAVEAYVATKENDYAGEEHLALIAALQDLERQVGST